ncbi:MAG: DUF3592 domain-containing protein [Anaerolineaceae bacterium]|nr:DUF3592 domain-containing protein [Anaerolineaceae bacterium]
MEIPIVVLLVSLILILFALYKIWTFIQKSLKKSNSQTWQKTTAEVFSKTVARKISTKSGISYYPEIEYRYTVMGQSFEKKIRLPKNYTLQKAEEIINNLGTTIEVHYNPNQPKEHISEYEKANYLDIVVGVISLVLAGIMLFPYLS